MLFWHLGGTIALVRYAFRDERMDLRFLALGAILPDLIDTPIGLAFFESLQSVRLIGHTLILSGGVMVGVVLATRRGRPRKRWMPLAIGMLVHLFLDAMWANPETLWWPFLGIEFAPADATSPAAFVRGVVADWRVWALEAFGFVYLGELARRSGLGSASARSMLWTTGRVDAPIRPQ